MNEEEYKMLPSGEKFTYATTYFYSINLIRKLISEGFDPRKRQNTFEVEALENDMWARVPMQLKYTNPTQYYKKIGIKDWREEWKRTIEKMIEHRTKNYNIEIDLSQIRTFMDLWWVIDSLRGKNETEEVMLIPIRIELKSMLITEVHQITGMHMRMLRRYEFKRSRIRVIDDENSDKGEE